MKIKMEIEMSDLDKLGEDTWESRKGEDGLWSDVKFYGLLTFWTVVVAIVVYQALNVVS